MESALITIYTYYYPHFTDEETEATCIYVRAPYAISRISRQVRIQILVCLAVGPGVFTVVPAITPLSFTSFQLSQGQTNPHSHESYDFSKQKGFYSLKYKGLMM